MYSWKTPKMYLNTLKMLLHLGNIQELQSTMKLKLKFGYCRRKQLSYLLNMGQILKAGHLTVKLHLVCKE